MSMSVTTQTRCAFEPGTSGVSAACCVRVSVPTEMARTARRSASTLACRVAACRNATPTCTPIRESTLVQAKGRTYSLTDLLDSGRDAERFLGGNYATIYLSPRDYHRVHSPASGDVTHLGYVPGHLWPVNPLAVGNIDQLFAVNERLTTFMTNDVLGDVGVIMVGATCVGRMTLAFHDAKTNGSFRRREDLAVEDVHLDHGDELGMFNLGSTVILLIAAENFEFDPSLSSGDKVQVGQYLGAIAG